MGTRARRVSVGLVASAAIVGLVLRFDPGTLPEVTRYRDDAYYYFSFVRDLATGRGPCVTPGVPTNGVHVLWAAMLWPLYGLFGDRGFVVGAQHLGLGLHVLTAAGLWLLLGKGTRAAVVALLYLGNPTLIVEAQNGQETAIACLATLGLCWGFRRSTWVAAGMATLAVCARSDLVFLVPALGVARFGWRAVAVVPCLVALIAYVGVDVALAGRWLQDSAAPIPWLFAAHFERTEPDFAARLHRWWWYLRPCLLGAPYAVVSPVLGGVLTATVLWGWLRPPWRILPLLLTGLGVAVGASDVGVPLVASLLLLLSRSERRVHDGVESSAALVGFAGIVMLHLFVRTYPRDYYFAPLGVLGSLAFAGLPTRAACVASGLLLLGNVAQWFAPPVLQTWQEQMAMAGRYLRDVVPADEPVGCFNSGIVAFHDAGAVLNLDGVVNHDAYDALRAGALGAYLDRHAVRFLVDSPEQVALDGPWPHSSGVHFGGGFDPARDLVEVARFLVPGIGGSPFTLYWRRGRGRPPEQPSARVLGGAPAVGERRSGVYVLWPASGPARLEMARLAADGAPTAGVRTLLASVDTSTTVILRVDAANPGRHGLFVDGAATPILTVDL
ncbi:MAG: hypothetical protein R3F56_07825 [Planctomycetota bacterium]